MAVSFPGDLVLEVAQSRRPERYARILERLKTENPTEGGVIAQNKVNAMTATGGLHRVSYLTHSNGNNVGVASQNVSPFRMLEAQLMKHLLETMLPASAAGGKSASAANGYWKSTLADTLAQKISESAQIGLAAKLHGAFDRNANSANAFNFRKS